MQSILASGNVFKTPSVSPFIIWFIGMVSIYNPLKYDFVIVVYTLNYFVSLFLSIYKKGV